MILQMTGNEDDDDDDQDDDDDEEGLPHSCLWLPFSDHLDMLWTTTRPTRCQCPTKYDKAKKRERFATWEKF